MASPLAWSSWYRPPKTVPGMFSGSLMTQKNLASVAPCGVSRPKIRQNEPVKRPIDKQTLFLSVGVAFGLVLIVMGLQSATTGREAQNIPAAIEEMSPGPGDQVVQQAQISVDFIAGYEARLVIDDIALDTTRLDELSAEGNKALDPGAQVEIPPTAIFDPGNYIVSFTPQEGAPIELFTQGTHKATVIYWKMTDGPEKSRSFSWDFDAN